MEHVAYAGEHRRVVWARDSSGRRRGKDYFDELSTGDQAKLEVLFRRMGDHGEIRNIERFRHEGDGIYVFKSFKRRLACFHDGRDWVITHGFDKKRDRTPKSELDRAKRIRSDYTKEG